MRYFMIKKTGFRLILILVMVLILLASGCKSNSSGAVVSPDSASSVPGTVQDQPVKSEALQSGSLQAELLAEYDLFATVNGYAFYPDDRVELNVSARNESGHPGTVWVGFISINGWSVEDLSHSVTILQLAPGESQEVSVSFDLSSESGKAMEIRHIENLSLSCEGYLDSTQYEYYARLTDLEFPSEGSSVQKYGAPFKILADNEYLELGILPGSESYALLYLNVRIPVEEGKLELYPIENEAYNASMYPVPYSYSLAAAGRKIISISAFGASVPHPDGFGIIYRGVPLPSECVLQNDPTVTVSSGTMLAGGSSLEISYNPDENLLSARSLDSSRTLLLTVGSTWTRNGVELRSNPLSLPIFPGTSTSFRVSGRGTGADGVARSFQFDSATTSASVSFPVYDLDIPEANAKPIETIELHYEQ